MVNTKFLPPPPFLLLLYRLKTYRSPDAGACLILATNPEFLERRVAESGGG